MRSLFGEIIAFFLLSAETGLTENFIYTDGSGVGEIQTAKMFAHRNTHTAFQILTEKILGKTAGLFSEKEEYGSFIPNVGVTARSFRSEAIEIAAGIFVKEIFQIFIICNIELMPVVEPGAFELAVVNGKPHRFDDMQCGAGSGTGARDIAGVLRNFRLMQNDVDVFHFVFRLSAFEFERKYKSISQYIIAQNVNFFKS